MIKEIKSSDRKKLRGLAHHIKPIVQLGRNGLTDQLIQAVNTALNDHELIKLKFMDFKSSKQVLSEEISKKSQSQVVGMVGNSVIFYKPNPNEEKRKIVL